MFTFLHHEHSILCYQISSLPFSYMHAVMEEVFETHAVVLRCRNCPISRFLTRATISIFYNEDLHVWQQLLPWWTVSDYCILQHRHHGCCPFVGGSRPERSNFLSELPHFALCVVAQHLSMRHLILPHSRVCMYVHHTFDCAWAMYITFLIRGYSQHFSMCMLAKWPPRLGCGFHWPHARRLSKGHWFTDVRSLVVDALPLHGLSHPGQKPCPSSVSSRTEFKQGGSLAS